MHTHAHYEELCGLAATGQMPENEVAAFRTHLSECLECRSLVEDFAQVSVCLTGGHAAKRSRWNVPSGMTQRFVARARSEGISMSRGVAPQERSAARKWKPAAVAGIAASFLIIGFLIVAKVQLHQVSRQNVSPAISHTSTASVTPYVAPSHETQEQMEKLQRQLSGARAQVNAMTARMKTERNALDKEKQHLASLQAELHGLEAENAGLKASAGDHAAKVSMLQGEIEKLSAVKSASDIALMAEENELRRLRQSLLDKEAALRQQQHLVEVGSQVRNLIVARNMHIVDVYDSDGDGNEQRAFGRIFYSEGKSLIFYAYDLTDPRKVDQQVSFYAWGERMGGAQPVKRLGIFHSEDANQGRWVLTFDDPHVLAQINSVFVTVEKDKQAITRPKGKRILNAFLGNKANHP